MTSNPSHTARTVSPVNVAVYVFAASQIIPLPIGHAVLAAAAIGGGYAVYRRLPEPYREKAANHYARAKDLLREHLSRTSGKIRHATRRTVIRIQRIVANGVMIILIFTAFAEETLRQFVETLRLSAQVWAGDEQEPVYAAAEAA